MLEYKIWCRTCEIGKQQLAHCRHEIGVLSKPCVDGVRYPFQDAIDGEFEVIVDDKTDVGHTLKIEGQHNEKVLL